MRRDFSRAWVRPGSSSEASMAMMAITTSNSMRVNEARAAGWNLGERIMG